MRLGTCLGLFTSICVCAAFLGCGSEDSGNGRGTVTGTGSTTSGSGGAGTGTGSVTGTGGINLGTGATGTGDDGEENPASCGQAADSRSYVGCDFWPTVTFNPVDRNFDFAAVVANAGTKPAVVSVERGGTKVGEDVTVQPGELAKIPLPWITELKGPDFTEANTAGSRASSSVRLDKGAYHLTSTEPVTVWQFSPLQFTKNLPAPCIYQNAGACQSVTNDASLLIPSTAMTGNYRVAGVKTIKHEGGSFDDAPPFVAITATQDDTNVTLKLGPEADVQSGTGVTAAAAGSEMTFTMNAGDVVQVLGKVGTFSGTVDDPANKNGDLAGTLIVASRPVQAISGVPITYMPSPASAGQGYADHLEETLLPAEALGAEYVVAPPSTPLGTSVGHFVRFIGNFDGTTLEYPGGAPAGAPTTLAAGERSAAIDITQPFVVKGNKSFAVLSVMKGGQIQDAGGPPPSDRGDPSMTFAVATPQYRKKYIFLAPDDYTVSYADVIVPDGANVTVDGQALTAGTAIGTSGWSIARQLLSAGNGGAHVLESDLPVGLQIGGFGHATSFYVPGGLNLKIISDIPIK